MQKKASFKLLSAIKLWTNTKLYFGFKL